MFPPRATFPFVCTRGRLRAPASSAPVFIREHVSPHADRASIRYNGAVRVTVCGLLVVFVLGGCGNDLDVELVWGGPPDAAPGGAVSTQGFAGFLQEVDEDWERSPALAAGVFLRLDERKASRITIDATGGPEGGGGQIVTVTLDGLADDSVRAERWTLGFEEAGEGRYTLTGALRELRCHEGRGHQDFASEACV
jgi:hypothetical protein